MPILLSSVNVTTLALYGLYNFLAKSTIHRRNCLIICPAREWVKGVLAVLNPHIYYFVEDVTQTHKNTNEQKSDGKSILLNLYVLM